ncbi:MAG: pyruvate carboxylase [Candidatus Dadabacteria bacterium]|nr:pyruvate carboxylase [Candidatus Dadabacteria bacterium]NIQ17046.1 pyruvate carboxylase [Candidatus Dadabacteria bacterium]
MIAEGFKLMVLGMVIVYIFLVVLMIFVIISARIFKNRGISQAPLAKKIKSDNENIVAVISAAISAFKVKNQNK